MLALAQARVLPVHVLLTKSDKLGRGAARQTLHAVQRGVGQTATAQLFSSLTGEGLAEAGGRGWHDLLVGRKKETPAGPAEPTGEE